MPVSLLKLIVPVTEDDKGKKKDKFGKSKKLGAGGAFGRRKSSRVATTSRQRTSPRGPGTVQTGTGHSARRADQSEERSTIHKRTATIGSAASSTKSPHFEQTQTLSSIHSLENRGKTKRNSVGDAENPEGQRLQMLEQKEGPGSPRLIGREAKHITFSPLPKEKGSPSRPQLSKNIEELV